MIAPVNIDSVLEDITRKYHLADAEHDESQVVSILKQIFLSGDIYKICMQSKYVVPVSPDVPFRIEAASKIVYTPFKRVSELEKVIKELIEENQRLKEENQTLKNHLYGHLPGCDND